MENSFEPEVTLEHTERAQIAQTVATSGWNHINRIMRSEVDKYIVALINIPESDEGAIVAAHRLSKAAAQVYTGITNRIRQEVQQYSAVSTTPLEPIDITEGLIDIGSPASTLADLDYEDQLVEEESE